MRTSSSNGHIHQWTVDWLLVPCHLHGKHLDGCQPTVDGPSRNRGEIQQDPGYYTYRAPSQRGIWKEPHTRSDKNIPVSQSLKGKLVEAAGIEPASANSPPMDLHA